MKLWAVSMVRNEADIIEAFVRHNLAFLDGLAVLDHRSTDGTLEILSRLKQEGLQIARLRTEDAGFFQGSRITELARECFERMGADFVFALDADEFITANSRDVIEQLLSQVPPQVYPLQSWRTYVPTSFEAFGPHCLCFRLREEPRVRSKVIVRRFFLERPHERVSEGNHWVMDTQSHRPAEHRVLPCEALSLAHCPVRSRRQFENKVRHGYEALLAAGSPRASLASHWREIYEDLERGIALTDARLRLIAANYGVPQANWVPEANIGLVEDPIELKAARGSEVRA